MKHVRLPGDVRSEDRVGGKAAGLVAATRTKAEVPPWFVVLPSAYHDHGILDGTPMPSEGVEREVAEALARIGREGDVFAVRSSALEEDGVEASFAGQYETVLAVTPEEIPKAIGLVWASRQAPHVGDYRARHGLEGKARPPAVIVQRMLRPSAAGVAFGVDPVSGETDVAVVSSVPGLGSTLVSGRADADVHRVRKDGTIVERRIAAKTIVERVNKGGGTTTRALRGTESREAAVNDDQARAIARLAWNMGEVLGRPQDIEWALEGGKLWLLQTRPITGLDAAAVTLWDNSNIAESYAGVTTPLTFTFARTVYAAVYREMCMLLRVSPRRVAAEAASFENLLGLIDGRMYYNLVSWYRILALLPGFRFNRVFMEEMMGVAEELPPDLLAQIESSRRVRGRGWSKIRSAVALLHGLATIDRKIHRFTARLDAALAAEGSTIGSDLPGLAREYRRLEGALLKHWDAPVLNDFFAMIFFGALGRVCTAWIGDTDGSIKSALLCGEEKMVSAEPPRLIGEMARVARMNEDLVETLREGPIKDAVPAIHAVPALARLYDAYLERFGDRCLQELKLESPTLKDDPTSLVRTIGEMASRAPSARDAATDGLRAQAEVACVAALKRSPIRRAAFWWILRNARARVRDRENLRFERTRVFGRVRRIFVEMGRLLARQGVLDSPRDVFFLELEELLSVAEGGPSDGLAERARRRRAETEAYRAMPAPPDRFLMRGDRRVASAATAPETSSAGNERSGIGCCPGVVRGPARVVTDPRGATVRAGEILVARHTDPGWVLLFGAAEGLVVQHGSLLSHAAIVSREMGIPSVVGVDGLMEWVRDGDVLEIDGRAGRVRKVFLAEADS